MIQLLYPKYLTKVRWKADLIGYFIVDPFSGYKGKKVNNSQSQKYAR